MPRRRTRRRHARAGRTTDPVTPASERGRRRLRASLRIGLVAVVLVPLLSGSLGAPPVASGDELSDALAKQKALAGEDRRPEAEGRRAQRAPGRPPGRDLVDLGQARRDQRRPGQVKADVKQMTVRVNAVKAVYDDQVAQLADLDAQLAEIQAEEDAKAAQLAERKTLLADHVRAAYDSDRTSLLETILSADSFSDALADVGYLIDIGDQDAALAAQISGRPADALRAQPDGLPDPLRHRPAAGRDGRPEEGPRREPGRPQEGPGQAQEARGGDRQAARPPAQGVPRHGHQQGGGQGDPGQARPGRTRRSSARSTVCWPPSSTAAASRPSTAAASTGRSPGRSPRSSAAPASRGSRRTATAPTSTRGSTSPSRSARGSMPPEPGRSSTPARCRTARGW